MGGKVSISNSNKWWSYLSIVQTGTRASISLSVLGKSLLLDSTRNHSRCNSCRFRSVTLSLTQCLFGNPIGDSNWWPSRKKSPSLHFWWCSTIWSFLVSPPTLCRSVFYSYDIAPPANTLSKPKLTYWLFLPFWGGTLHRFLFLTWTRLRLAEEVLSAHCTTGAP